MLVNARGVQHKLLAGGYCVDSIYTAVKTINRYKKARRACAVRAFRTSSDDSGNHRWRILGWRPCDLCFNILIYIGILCLFSIEGSIMEPLSETAERLTSNYAKR